ncbi:hypothetical protein C8Q72DRAFT_791064 [Fomitopsis betulina]|nr:hypothetical protein C8Q72DRAFT_791064 [Fomitopsis betulina]
MQFKLSLATIAVLVAAVVAFPAAEAPVTLMTQDEMMNWLKTTDATLTFIGNPIPGVNAPEGLVSREALSTMLTVYNGGAKCLNAPDTVCLAATNNVAFCDRKGCNGSCHDLAQCGTHLDNGYCYTPGTASIIVSNA